MLTSQQSNSSCQTELYLFEKNLEALVKAAFKKAIIDDNEIEIAADYNTHSGVDEIIKGYGLSVYGMAITPSEFTITFEFGIPFSTTRYQGPRYCKIQLQNDGNYHLSLTEESLEDNWYLSVQDDCFNIRTLDEKNMMQAIDELNKVLFLLILSN